jgi:alkylhydroperoxidase family enzyme
MAAGKQLGINEEELHSARRFESENAQFAAALEFVKKVLELKGHVSDDDVLEIRKAGYGDTEIVELVANVILNILTNYINDTAQTDIDFPLAQDLP